jgi:hypothetical protein
LRSAKGHDLGVTQPHLAPSVFARWSVGFAGYVHSEGAGGIRARVWSASVFYQRERRPKGDQLVSRVLDRIRCAHEEAPHATADCWASGSAEVADGERCMTNGERTAGVDEDALSASVRTERDCHAAMAVGVPVRVAPYPFPPLEGHAAEAIAAGRSTGRDLDEL